MANTENPKIWGKYNSKKEFWKDLKKNVINSKLTSHVGCICALFILITITLIQFFGIYIKDISKIQIVIGYLPSIMISVLVFTHTTLILAIQMSHSQFTPRAMRLYIEDKYNLIWTIVFITVFAGTFLLYFIVESEIHIPVDIKDLFFKFSTFVIVFSVLFSIFYISHFVNFISHNLNIASLARKIWIRTSKEIDELYGTYEWDISLHSLNAKQPEFNEEKSIFFHSLEVGFVDTIKYEKLFNLESSPSYKKFCSENKIKAGKIIQAKTVGSFVGRAGNLIAIELTEETESRISELQVILDNEKKINKKVREIFKIYTYRNLDQDTNLGLRQLSDISIKALSPAINDPTTSTLCLLYITEILSHMSLRQPLPTELVQQEISENKVFWGNDIKHSVHLGFTQIYHYGKTESYVLREIYRSLGKLVKEVKNPYYLMVFVKKYIEITDDFTSIEVQRELDTSITSTEITKTIEKIHETLSEILKRIKQLEKEIQTIGIEKLNSNNKTIVEEKILPFFKIVKTEYKTGIEHKLGEIKKQHTTSVWQKWD